MVSTDGMSRNVSNMAKMVVEVLYPPLIKDMPDKSVTEGSLLNASCQFVPGNPAETKLKWTRDSDIYEWNGLNLYLRNVSRSDQTTYRCTVENIMKPSGQREEKGIANKSFYLNVEYAASVELFYVNGFSKQSTVTVNESLYISFTCKVSGYPVPTINISFLDKELLPGNQSNHLLFSLGPASCLDAGTYICRGYNTHNNGINSAKLVHLFVNSRHRKNPLVALKQNITTAKNVPVHINFTAIAYPQPMYAWQKYNEYSWTSLEMNDNIRIFQFDLNFSITILNVSERDSGEYKIVMSNTFGSHEEHFSIIVQDFPEGTDSRSATATGVVVGLYVSFLVITIATAQTSLDIGDKEVIKDKENVYEMIKPDEERGTPEKTEKEYEELKADNGGFSSSNPIYTNLTL